jgi:hypothetical protein
MTEPPPSYPEPPTANYQLSPPQQPPYQAQYPQPYPYAPPRKTNTMAIIALILSFVFFPVGLIMGYMAKREIEQTGEDGEGLAKAAIIIGWVHVAILVLVCVGLIAFFGLFAATASSSG